MGFNRSSGILLHPTSLPGRYGIGELGEEARRFVDFLRRCEQRLWQVMPLGPTGYGDSPYQCFSAFAGNTLLIDLRQLVEEKLLDNANLSHAPQFSADRVDFGRVIEFKNEMLRRAHERFNHTTDTGLRAEFEGFCRHAASWLDDYALFRALKDKHGGAAWNNWGASLKYREPDAMARAREEQRDQVEAQKFYQYLFFKQWSALKAYCRERSVSIIGDIPIFVAYDSADVWAHRELFKLDEAGAPLVVSGVPPDYFSRTGQLWGNPLYDWDKMRADDFHWWARRVEHALWMTDVARLDHFRGFAACWEVPGKDETAEHGQWVPAMGRELFTTLKRRLGELPVIAEDLGVITPDVESLRDDFDFPGMRILQFAFGGDPRNKDLPHNYTRNTVVYTGTHDNDTTLGWFKSSAGKGSTRDAAQVTQEHKFCLDYLNSRGSEIHWDMIRAALASVADLAIIPLQDVLGLGAEARMNLPSSIGGNWSWRYAEGTLTNTACERLKEMTLLYGRA